MTSTPFKNITFNHVSGISSSISESTGYYGFSCEVQMIPEEEKEHEELPIPAENSGKEVKEEYVPLTKAWLLYFSSYISQNTTDNDIPILHHPLDTSTPPPEH